MTSSLLRAWIVGGLLLTCATTALGDRVILRYDADDGNFPEEEGWSRSSGSYPDGKVVRSIGDGVFRIDSLDSRDWDLYKLASTDLLPASGESLRVDWRMRVLQQGDPGVPNWPGEMGMHIWLYDDPSFYMAPDSVSVLTASGYSQICSLAPTLWHTYSFLTDAQNGALFVDGQLVFQSAQHKSESSSPIVLWGDTWIGASGGAVSEWDYVQVSIVPEPGGIMIGIVAFLIVSRTTRKGT